MLFDLPPKPPVELYVSRAKDLLSTVKQQHKEAKSGIILLFSGFEKDGQSFEQESSFFYLTGIEEPGVAIIYDLDGKKTLYVPNYLLDRKQWLGTAISHKKTNPSDIGVNKIELLGDGHANYSIGEFFPKNIYKNLLKRIKEVVDSGGKIFTLNPKNDCEYVQQRLVLERIKGWIPGFEESLIDISPVVASARREKDMNEIEQIYKAVLLSIFGHEGVVQTIKREQELTEIEAQGMLEYFFTAEGCTAAYPPIVASGKNGTIIHHEPDINKLKDGDLVLIDAGAKINHYCADLTRTYPVSGKFTARQKELYKIVLETQEYIASIARPGMWLVNTENKDKSLYHLAKAFLDERGVGKYFLHGIGHFLGLDVHDVGDPNKPLQFGDVFTIEPGIYIPEENIGIRIEDDYWMVKDGVVCLSESLPKDPDEIEKMMVGKHLRNDSVRF